MERVKIVGDFRFTISSRGVTVEALDYHAEPTFLSRFTLHELGLSMKPPDGDDRAPAPTRARHA